MIKKSIEGWSASEAKEDFSDLIRGIDVTDQAMKVDFDLESLGNFC